MTKKQPGLYVATVHSVEGVRILGPDRDGWWAYIDDDGDVATAGPSTVTDARPLVVLDPEHGSDRHAFRRAFYEATGRNITPREALDILRALASPPAPKPEESTGLGGCRAGGGGDE